MANFEKTCSKIKNFFATTIKKNKKTQLRKTLYGLIYCLLQVKTGVSSVALVKSGCHQLT